MIIISQEKRRIAMVLMIALLLSIPLVAMQFTEEVKWTLFDFIVAGVLLSCTGFALEFMFKKIKNTKHRILAFALILIILFLVWIELAVGIFDTPLGGQ
ncbi:MAG: hypothetical protein MUE81_09600 [Thermoflexibacter sp.]|jgi:uncharacterized protein YybS (DUF2232 family)|nr:hypothetical protein [Thermoflexibacter sp.]